MGAPDRITGKWAQQGFLVQPVTEEVTGIDIVQAKGLYVTPGLVDLHTHIYHGATDLSLRPEQIGLKTGVTCLVDCGSAGEANFEANWRWASARWTLIAP